MRVARKNGRAPFDAFVAKQKLSPEEKQFLRRGLKNRAVRDYFAANSGAPTHTKPTAAPGNISEALENRAARSATAQTPKASDRHSQIGVA